MHETYKIEAKCHSIHHPRPLEMIANNKYTEQNGRYKDDMAEEVEEIPHIGGVTFELVEISSGFIGLNLQ